MTTKKPRKKTKATQKDLDFYRERVEHWMTFFGLHHWKIWVVLEQVESAYGFCRASMEAQNAVIGLSPYWGGEEITKATLESTARHEVLELLLSPMWHAVLARELNKSWAESQRHQIIRTLEQILARSETD